MSSSAVFSTWAGASILFASFGLGWCGLLIGAMIAFLLFRYK